MPWSIIPTKVPEIVGYRGLCQPGRRQERGIMETERDIAIVKTGSVYVVVGTSSPTPNLEGSGIDPKEMDIVMVKQGYLVTHGTIYKRIG